MAVARSSCTKEEKGQTAGNCTKAEAQPLKFYESRRQGLKSAQLMILMASRCLNKRYACEIGYPTWGVIFGLPRIRIKLREVRCLKICEPRPYGLYSIDLYLGHLGMLNCIGVILFRGVETYLKNPTYTFCAQKQIGFGQLRVTSKPN